MVCNQLIACEICDTKINLRIQMGYVDIPFHINCPKCVTSISGKVLLDQENATSNLKIENAHEVPNDENDCYEVELSGEFPTKKIHLKEFGKFDLSPFIRNSSFYGGNSVAHNATRKAMQFVFSDWERLIPYFELFWSNNKQLLYPKLESEINKYDYIPMSKVNNDLDAFQALHQLFIMTSYIASVLPNNAIKEYIDAQKLIFNNKENLTELTKLVSANLFEFNEIEKRFIELIKHFTKIYEQIIPVVSLKNANCIDNVDKDQFGITTADFNMLTDFYAKSYEWILDNVDIIILFNNISVRNIYEDCGSGKSYSDIPFLRSKFKKLEYLNDNEPFSQLNNHLRNRIRNAIQHFNCNIDYITQKITFKDNHAGRTNEETIYLIDFANLCLENFNTVIYIVELFYNLRKFSFIAQGLEPSYIPKRDDSPMVKSFRNKTGRNSICPCGSGKKYKHCCLSIENF